MTKKNFSLIELLVSISILTVLLTLVVRSLERTYSLSQNIECASHLQQHGKGIQLYTDDHNNIIPSRNILTYENGEYDSSNRHVAWKFQIANYVLGASDVNYEDYSKKDPSDTLDKARATHVHPDLITGIFECPSVRQHTFSNGLEYDDIHFSRKGGYGWNYLLQDESNLTTTPGQIFDLGVNYSVIEKPAETMMLGDTLNPDVSFTFPQVLYHPNRMGTRLYATHNGGINLLWTDQHVENLTDFEIRTASSSDTAYYFKHIKD